ncbi:MAG: hypothetical protein KTR14_00885 [Vampirovibrio sp.]|nr:hypothetical protein [Vampirovibrio sp.]
MAVTNIMSAIKSIRSPLSKAGHDGWVQVETFLIPAALIAPLQFIQDADQPKDVRNQILVRNLSSAILAVGLFFATGIAARKAFKALNLFKEGLSRKFAAFNVALLTYVGFTGLAVPELGKWMTKKQGGSPASLKNAEHTPVDAVKREPQAVTPEVAFSPAAYPFTGRQSQVSIQLYPLSQNRFRAAHPNFASWQYQPNQANQTKPLNTLNRFNSTQLQQARW